jgi:hypothetical protein
MNPTALIAAGLAGTLALSASAVSAQTVELDFVGGAGEGLLPGNARPVANNSSAFGGEVGSGLILDRDAGTLDFAFDFQNLSGGLADVASGIHLHIITDTDGDGTDDDDSDDFDVNDFFDATGGIAFNLNSGTDANVQLDTPLIAFGATDGTVTGTVLNLSDEQEDAFLEGRYYLNIHTADFNPGEIRGNVVVPEPATLGLLAAASLGLLRRR